MIAFGLESEAPLSAKGPGGYITSFTAHCRIISLKIRLRLILQFLEFKVLPVVNFVGLMPLAGRMFLIPARTPGGTQLLLSPSGLCPRPQGQAQPHASFSATLGHSGQALVLPVGGVLYTLTSQTRVRRDLGRDSTGSPGSVTGPDGLF